MTLSPKTIMAHVASILDPTALHPMQVLSLSHGVLGVMSASQAGVANIGRGMAQARETSPKHAVKQFDRLLGNEKISDDEVFRGHLGFVLGARPEIVVALDWTEHAADGHHRIALSLVTRHGRATPLIWKTHLASKLKDHRNDYEDALLRRFKKLLPDSIKFVEVLADRGFGDSELFEMLKFELGFDFTIRIREGIRVEDQAGVSSPGEVWVPSNGRARVIKSAKVTRNKVQVGAVVAVKKAGMKESWILVTSRTESGEATVKRYARRFTIEENFRDEKDPRFGLGTLSVRIEDPARRDRMMQVIAIATVLLTLLGSAGESLGLDRGLRANTVKRRTHSLFRQGREYLRGSCGKTVGVVARLQQEFLALVRNQPHATELLGEI
jgi:hypothetical protein